MNRRFCTQACFISLLVWLVSGCASSGEERTLTTLPRTAEPVTKAAPPAEPGSTTHDDPPAVVPTEVSVGSAGDRDADGIADANDRCPDDPEDQDAFQDDEGCPDPDNDADGIPDVNDQCPTDPEDLDGLQDSDGCPD